jgi:putative ABC transport system ATP-binding protein
VVNGGLKFQINTMKGWLGERMLRRLRYALFDHILRFPLARFRRVKSAELATMIKDEVEPLGGFVGESMIAPTFYTLEAFTAMFFIMYQHIFLGLIALAVVVAQAVIIPRLRRRLLVLSASASSARASSPAASPRSPTAPSRSMPTTPRTTNAPRSPRAWPNLPHPLRVVPAQVPDQVPQQFPLAAGAVHVLPGGRLPGDQGQLDIGTLVAVIAAYKDLPSPIKELIDWDQQRMDVQIKYTQVVEQFTVEDITPPELQAPIAAPQLPAPEGVLRVSGLTLAGEAGTKLIDGVSFEVGLDQHVAILGSHAAGAGELTQMMARLIVPSSGPRGSGRHRRHQGARVGDRARAGLRRAGGLPVSVSVRENLLYGPAPLPAARRALRGRGSGRARVPGARGRAHRQHAARFQRRLDRLRRRRRNRTGRHRRAYR